MRLHKCAVSSESSLHTDTLSTQFSCACPFILGARPKSGGGFFGSLKKIVTRPFSAADQDVQAKPGSSGDDEPPKQPPKQGINSFLPFVTNAP